LGCKETGNQKIISHAARLTNYLTKKLSEARDKALQMETEETQVSAQEIKETIRNNPDVKEKVKAFRSKRLPTSI